MFQVDNTQALTPDASAIEAPAAPAEVFTINSVNSEERACWLLRKLANLDAEEARVKAQFATMLAQVRTDRESLLHRFGSELEAFARQEIDRKGGRRKSLTLLQGTLAFRTAPARLTVADEAAALVAARSWQSAATRSGFDLLPQTLNRQDYQKFAADVLENTGELLPGVEMLNACETFKVSFKGAPESGEETA